MLLTLHSTQQAFAFLADIVSFFCYCAMGLAREVNKKLIECPTQLRKRILTTDKSTGVMASRLYTSSLCRLLILGHALQRNVCRS